MIDKKFVFVAKKRVIPASIPWVNGSRTSFIDPVNFFLNLDPRDRLYDIRFSALRRLYKLFQLSREGREYCDFGNVLDAWKDSLTHPVRNENGNEFDLNQGLDDIFINIGPQPFELKFAMALANPNHLEYDKYLKMWKGLMALCCFANHYGVTESNGNLLVGHDLIAISHPDFGWVPTKENIENLELPWMVDGVLSDPMQSDYISLARKSYLAKWISLTLNKLDAANLKLRNLLDDWHRSTGLGDDRTIPLSIGNAVFSGPIQPAQLSNIADDPFLPYLTRLPLNPHNTNCLQYGDNEQYLLPIRPGIWEDFRLCKTYVEKTISNEIRVSIITKYRFEERTYYSNNVVSISDKHGMSFAPYIEIWPDFRHDDWHDYYLYIDTHEHSDFPDDIILKDHNSKQIQNGMPTRSDSFFDAIMFYRKDDTPLGIIISKAPESALPDLQGQWDISIDFGAANTCVFYKKANVINFLAMQDRTLSLGLLLVQETKALREAHLWSNFFTPKILDNQFITAYMARNLTPQSADPRVILDGVLYSKEGKLEWTDTDPERLKSSLKWDTELFPFVQLFLVQIALMIRAEAFANNAKINSYKWAYPGAFSVDKHRTYTNVWRNITGGVAKHKTECEANYAYFRNTAKYMELAGNTVIVDIGGSTSDISIFRDMGGRTELIQSSIKFAAESLHQIAKHSADFRSTLLDLQYPDGIDEVRRQQISKVFEKNSSLVMNSYFKSMTDGNLNRILSYSDPTVGGKHAQVIRPARSMAVLNLIGIIYYAAMMCHKATAGRNGHWNLCLAGNGSRLLKWVGDNGDQQELINMIFRSINGDRSSVALVRSHDIKEEVGRGLLLAEYPEDRKKEEEGRGLQLAEDPGVLNDVKEWVLLGESLDENFTWDFDAKVLFSLSNDEDREILEKRADSIRMIQEKLTNKQDWQDSHLQKTIEIYTKFKNDFGQHIEHIPTLPTLQRDRQDFFMRLSEIPLRFHDMIDKKSLYVEEIRFYMNYLLTGWFR
ncbi:MAG: hypothetical protein LHW51_02850 [Candidatus Cloacimonetes bacterium]|nr:hypothetical protein [Candidatus Cloacimonadota bacterium]